MTEQPLILQLADEYAGMRNIPDVILSQHGLIRHTDERGVVRIVSKDIISQQAQLVIPILREYEGYLFSADYEYLILVRRGQVVADDRTIRRIVGCAQSLKSRGVPAIYDTVTFGYGSGALIIDTEKDRVVGVTKFFPNVDYVIQYTTGAYEKYQAARMIHAEKALGSKKARRVGIAMWRASYADIQLFSRIAFDAYGSMLMPLMREIEYHSSSSFRFNNVHHMERALCRTDRAFVILESLLRPLALRENREYLTWDGNVDVVGRKRWFLDYEPSEHESIAQAYFASLSSLPVGNEMGVYLRMAATFPGCAPTVEDLWSLGHGEAVGFALRDNNFLNLPGKLFSETFHDRRIYDAALAHLDKCCSEWVAEMNTFALGHVVDIASAVKIPLAVVQLSPFMDILNTARWTMVRAMNDEQFTNYFRNEAGKFAIGQFGVGISGEGIGKGLRTFVLDRCRNLAA